MKYYIGVDLGGTNIGVGLVSQEGEIVYELEEPTHAERPYNEIFFHISDMITNLLALHNIQLEDIIEIGMGIPGTMNSNTGICEFSNHFKWNFVDVLGEMRKYFPDTTIKADNDANAAGYGEFLFGSGKGTKCFVLLTLGTGIGGAVIINNHIMRGFNCGGAELGHIIIEKDGVQCTCGAKGCFEAYSSATGLIDMFYRERGRCTEKNCAVCSKEKVLAKDIFQAESTCSAARYCVEEYYDYLGCGITSIINVFQPEILAIGGGVSNMGDSLIEKIRDRVFSQVFSRFSKENTKMQLAELGNDAGIVGAALQQ